SALEDILDEGAQIDLADLLRMEWAAFYGRGENAVNPGIAYAQSWSLVTFLRSGKHSACVDRYWAALRESAKKWKAREASAAIKEGRPVRPAGAMPEAEAVAIRKAALEEGFAGVDLDALDDAWFDFANR
ncbi:MAG TPA: hypothetical protein VFS92_06675, partial [Planctomycetota bacterium]|nr:hypothetical protein [Planctomycetota bacterium]